jgi:hypothetical protein
VLHVAKDIHLIGVNVSEPAGNGIMVAQEASTEARLRKELWTDLGDSAPPAVGISDVMIGSPNLRNVGLNGIFVQGGTPHAFHVNVSNPNIYGIPARRYAISYAMVDDSTISGGTIVSVNSGPTGGVKASAGAGITVSGVNLSTSYDGVDLVACTGCLVISNIIAGSNGNFGVYVDPTGKGNSVSGNSITGTFAGDRIRSQDSTSLVGSNPGADRK